MQVQINARATMAKSAASAFVVEAVQRPLRNGNGVLATTDRNEFGWEVLILIHLRPFSLFLSVAF
jgi:hypothetical protein